MRCDGLRPFLGLRPSTEPRLRKYCKLQYLRSQNHRGLSHSNCWGSERETNTTQGSSPLTQTQDLLWTPQAPVALPKPCILGSAPSSVSHSQASTALLLQYLRDHKRLPWPCRALLFMQLLRQFCQHLCRNAATCIVPWVPEPNTRKP